MNLVASIPIEEPLVDFVSRLVGRSALKGRVKKPLAEDERDAPWENRLLLDLQDIPEGRARGIMGEELKSRLPRRTKSKLQRRLQELGDSLHLSDAELEILSLLYCYDQCPTFEALCDKFSRAGYGLFLARATGISITHTWNAVSREGRLCLSGLLVPGCPPSTTVLSDGVKHFLAGVESTSFAERFCVQYSGDTFPLDSFPVAPAQADVVQRLVSAGKPVHILIYGVAGTGKTEFAKSVIRSAGKAGFFVRNGAADPRPDRSCRRLALTAAGISVDSGSAALVVDEADDFLNTSPFMMGTPNHGGKGWINTFMDNHKGVVVWITNETQGIPESTMRRFAYSIRFNRSSRKDRENIWNNLVQQHPLRDHITPGIITDLATRFSVNAAGIASALAAAPLVLGRRKRGAESVRAVLVELLERHMEATGVRGQPATLNALTDRYDIRAVNTDADAGLVMRSVQRFGQKLERENSFSPGLSMNLLFWGDPGTGKTEFAKYLADRAGMGLLARRASDLLSKWVGGTESNIRASFEQARKERSILLLDEADSFFINRSNADKSWETSQTNELLTQMENYGGILVCCTNLLDSLDPAVMRRFAWKVRFDPPSEAGRIALYEQYFGPSDELTSDQLARLKALDSITAGDIRAVWQKLQFVLDEASHEEIIRALATETSYRGKPGGGIGFRAVA
jgi:transitional endoplasmic reticulum ATPase